MGAIQLPRNSWTFHNDLHLFPQKFGYVIIL